MSDYNRFGVTAQKVLDLYPNVNATDMGGTSVIEDAIDRSVRRIASQIPLNVSEILNNEVTQEILVGPAFGGEGPTFTLGLGPIAEADKTKLRIYRVASASDGGKPSCPPVFEDNQTGTLAGTGNQTLTLTGSSVTLVESEWLMISYRIDTNDATFTMPTYGDYVVYAAAAELGSKLFDQETDSWVLVDKYKDLATEYLTSLQAGGFVDNSIRSLEFCEEIEPADATVMSIRKSRA